MNDELFNLDKLKEIFSHSTGTRKIEVTEEEYDQIKSEIISKNIAFKEENDQLSIKLGELEIEIVCEVDDDDF